MADIPSQEQAQPTIEESFRNSLDDTIEVLEKIGPLCTDIDELVSMLKLAIKNDAQLALIIKQVSLVRMRR